MLGQWQFTLHARLTLAAMICRNQSRSDSCKVRTSCAFVLQNLHCAAAVKSDSTIRKCANELSANVQLAAATAILTSLSLQIGRAFVLQSLQTHDMLRLPQKITASVCQKAAPATNQHCERGTCGSCHENLAHCLGKYHPPSLRPTTNVEACLIVFACIRVCGPFSCI